MQLLDLAGRPLRKQYRSGIFPAKERTQGLFECAPEQHRRPCVLLLPAVEIAIPIPPRAGEVLADLCVAVSHLGHLRIVEVCGRQFLPTTGRRESLESEQRCTVDRSEERRVGKECRYRG